MKLCFEHRMGDAWGCSNITWRLEETKPL